MRPVRPRLMRGAMSAYVWVYRRTGGRIGGIAPDRTPVLLLTVRGRTTGIPRTTPVGFFRHDGALLVVGAGGGSRTEPQWMRNLRAARTADVQILAENRHVTVRVAEGDERDRLWRDVVLARSPAFARTQARSGRTLPIAVLTPVG
jgi:deazaflavin-dependent oxidoreductase (nitroreductase family)